MADSSLRAEILGLLAKSSTPMRVPDLFNLSKLADSSTVIAATLHKETLAGRTKRTGECLRYAYTITDEGLRSIKGSGSIKVEQAEEFGTPPAKRSAPLTHSRPPPKAPEPITPQRTRGAISAPRFPSTDVSRSATGSPARPSAPPYLVDVAADFGVRLAARAVAEWPEPLEAMPAELRDWCAAHLAALSGVR